MKDERNCSNNETVTERIYEKDAYVKSFTAKVISCTKLDEDKFGIVLDRTAFFPEGGGQEADRGEIVRGDFDNYCIYDVQNMDGRIVHIADGPVQEGWTITCKINWALRHRRMQLHSGEHLFCGIIHSQYGFDNVGFHMDDHEVTLDVNGELTPEQLASVERMANMAIYENRAITASFPTSEECAKLEYRSKLDLTEGVRLVTIEGYDVCACCAPHVSTTAEIGIIKVIDSFYHRGGTRITLRAGASAYEDYAWIDKNNKGLMGLLSSKRYDTYEFAVRSEERYQALHEENVRLKKQFSEIEAARILNNLKDRAADDLSPIFIFSDMLDSVQMRNIINTVKEKYSVLVAGFRGSDHEGYDYIIGRGNGNEINLSAFAKELNSAFNGRGGGKPEMIQGHLEGTEEEIKNFFIK